jgi:hypothetical protein
MESVEVYLTKSGTVANLIYCGCNRDIGTGGVERVTCGRIDSEDGKQLVPAVFHGKGYFFCAVFTEHTDGTKAQRYEIIVA